MADTNQYRLKVVKKGTSIWSSVVSDAVRMSPEAQHLFQQPGGRINVAAHAVAAAAPIIEVDAYKIDLLSAPARDTVTLIFESGTDAGGAGATYVSYEADCLFVPVSLTASQQQSATLSVRCLLLSSDGTTSPITKGTTSASLAQANDIYTVGASSIDGAAVKHIVDQTVNFNYDIQTDEGQSGKLYPTTPLINSHAPDVQMTAQDVAEATEDRVNKGEKVTTNAVSLTFKHLNGGSDVTVSMAKGVIEAEVSGGQPSTVALSITGIDDDADDSTFVVVS